MIDGIFLESSKVKNLNSGLGQFTFHLVNNIVQKKEFRDIFCYVPQSKEGVFSNSVNYVYTSPWDRIIGVQSQAPIWHWLYQGSPYWPRNKNTKVVLTIHDLNFLYQYKGWKQKKALSYLQRQVDRADQVVTISQFTRNEVLKNLKIKEQSVSVIYNGVDSPLDNPRRPERNIQQKFLFAIGIVAVKKNFHVLIPAVAKLKDLSLIIAGNCSSDYAKSIQNTIKQMGLSDRVILVGEISESEKRWYFENCEGLVFPSLSEGFGLPVVEAMRFGKPVFCSNLTSLPEIAGELGYYFENFDADQMAILIQSGLTDFSNQPKKREQTIAWSNQFSWQKAAEKYLRLYASLH